MVLIEKNLFTLALVGLSFFAGAQKIDSLKNVLNSSSKTDRFDALYALAYEYSDVNDSLSLVYATDAVNLAAALGDSARMLKAGRIRAGELRRLDNIDEAISVASYSLGIARRRKDTSELKLLLNSLAVSHLFKADYDKALKYNFESLIIREALGNKMDISITQNNIGVIYYKLRDYARAIEFYKKALDYRLQANQKYDLDRLYINMALCYNSLGQYKEAKEFAKEGIALCGGKCSDQITLEGQLCLGASLYETKNYDESLQHFEQSYEVARKLNNYRFQVENLINFTKIYLIKKDFGRCEKYLTEAMQIAEKKGYRFLLTAIYEKYFMLYTQTGDYEKTALYQSKYIKLKDSILSEKVISNLAQVRTEYEERENIKTIAEKNQVLTLQREIIVRQQRQNFFIVAIACLIVALASLSYYFSRRQQRANKEISRAKNLIQEQNERLESHNKELEYKVTERTGDLLLSNNALQKLNDELDYFIYKSSHDIRGPLATLKGMCNIALMDLKDPTAINYFKKFDITTDKLNVILTRLQMVNYVTHSHLKPEPIDFKAIIEETIEFEKRKGDIGQFSFAYEIDPDCEIISDEFLVRTIIENLIDNAVKFRNASDRVLPRAKLKLTRENGTVKVLVEDNGIGIGNEYANDLFKMFVRASEQSEIGGVGLYLIKLAIDKAGGDVSLVQSSPNGSTFQVLFPLDINDVIEARNENEKKLVEMMMKQRGQVNTTPVS